MAEKLPFIIGKGCLVPADDYVKSVLRDRKYKKGDVVFGVITKPRNPKFNRLCHALGKMFQNNLDGFEILDPHQCLKRLQCESGVACDIISVMLPNIGLTPVTIPKSLSFDNMGEEEFQAAIKGICQHVVKQYWPTLTAEQVEEMALSMPEEI